MEHVPLFQPITIPKGKLNKCLWKMKRLSSEGKHLKLETSLTIWCDQACKMNKMTHALTDWPILFTKGNSSSNYQWHIDGWGNKYKWRP